MVIVRSPLRPLSELGIPLPNTGYAEFAGRHPEFIAELRPLREARRVALARLQCSNRRGQRDEVRQLLVSPNLRLFYAYEGLRKAGKLSTATPASIRALADRCDPFSSSPGGATPHFVFRRGRRRLVSLYSPSKRMQQALVADLIRHLHPPRPEQFLFNGGMPRALAAIEAAYRSGSHWAVQVDLIDFYGSVPFDGLAGLLRPLPASVVRHVVWDHVNIQGDERADPPLNGSPGLSLGSATSPIVGETIIGRVLAQLPQGMQVVTYADNILALGRDRDEAVARAQILMRTFENNSVMPLRPRLGLVASFAATAMVSDPSHIGVEFTHQVATVWEGALSWAPLPDRTLDYRVDDISPVMSMVEVARMENRVVRWRRAYPAWRGGQRWEAECLALLAGIRYFHEPGPLHLSAAVNAIIAAMVAWDEAHDVGHFIPDALGNPQFGRRRETLQRETDRFLSLRHDPVAA